MANRDHDDYESSGYETSTASLTSSINNYVFENGKLFLRQHRICPYSYLTRCPAAWEFPNLGRRYHVYFGPDKNLLPTDEIEQDRLDLHHEMLLMLLDGELHKAPIGDSPHRILDVGTGTGIWAIDMADMYPMAEVLGNDLRY